MTSGAKEKGPGPWEPTQSLSSGLRNLKDTPWFAEPQILAQGPPDQRAVTLHHSLKCLVSLSQVGEGISSTK